NGDVFGVMFDPLGALMAEGFTGSTDLSANYLVGLFEGDEAKVFKLNTSEPGDVTDKVEAAGHKTETGWCFELKISWDDIIADTEEASLGFVNITKEDILTRNSLIKTSVLYQDRFYDMESLSVETWGRYITAAETLPDGTPGHMGNGENIGSYGISLYLDICSSNGHSFTDYKYDGNATCSKDGTKTAYCDNGCGTKDTVTATGTSTGKHNYKESVLTEATCENEGIMLYLCECGNNYTKSIPKAHKEKWMVVVEPTTTEEGKEIKYCTVCTVVLETKTLPKKNSTVFVDVSASAWYSEGVSYCSGKGYITGIGNNKFNPEGKLSREQFVVILARVAGADLTKYTKTEFNDVEVNSWYGPSVIWSNESGYVNGTGNGRFGVGMNIDRESLATLFYRYAQKQGIDVDKRADLSGYSDYYLISSWSKEACSWAVNVGILGSTDINLLTLSPKMTVTRAQAAKIFMSYDNIK
ncbi:MAG: S-layer homology domain-containing protein, partial [Clostridia bacterium]|nr:S-layer homology domain-containing protein [Clostridia bacterium]